MMGLRRVGVSLCVFGVVAATIALGGSGARVAAAVPAGSSVTKSATAVRTFIDDGKTTTVASNKVSLTVGQTTGLRSLQQVSVSWSGAKQTAGIATDLNSDFAQNEEYSFDLFECRGVDSTTAPAAQQISPETCWTQFADERFVDGYQNYPAWRSDSQATTDERQASVGAPAVTDLASTCVNQLIGVRAQHWLPFVGADGTSYAGGPGGCQGQPAEAASANASSLSLPSNETYGVTQADGTGSTNFTIFTGEDHASLGCSVTVPCSLVAVPIEGLSCDAAGTQLPPGQQPIGSDLTSATTNCETSGNFAPGAPLQQISGQPAVDGSLWWSPSNWRNRISVPLTFAPADNACSLISGQNPIDLYGSELLAQATTSWSPAFCTNSKLFSFQHVQTPEPQARSLLTAGSIEAGLSSYAPTPAYTTPTVEAPVAVTGFGIAFDVDGTDGKPIVNLKLDARLIAKLLTESYPDQIFVQQGYPASKDGTETLSNNPLNMTDDPEFQALNPGIPSGSISDARSTLLLLNSDSDVVQALTSYIEADPEAKAFLQGDPDPWGMRVNPNYEGISLPVNNWPLLDSYEPKAYEESGNNPCLEFDPQPYLPLVAAPTSRLFSIAQDLEFAIAQSTTNCVQPAASSGGGDAADKLSAVGRETPGSRFLLGLVSLGDAARDGLSIASLETSESADAASKFTNADGRTFVAPSDTSLADAAKLLTQDFATHTWPVDYDKQRTVSGAYPGTMVVYAQVPTSGLPAADAAKYAKILEYAAGPGQLPGVAQGDLPAGYLPMTAANGLGGFATYTTEAAAAVAAQKGGLPQPPTTPASPPSGVVAFPTSSSGGGIGSGQGDLTGGDLGSTGGGTSPASTSSTGASTKTPAAASKAGATKQPAVQTTASSRISTGAVSAVLPVLAIVAVIAALGSAFLLTRRPQS